MNETMRSMNDVIELFNATFQPRSPMNQIGRNLIARAQNMSQSMSVSLQSFSAMVQVASVTIEQYKLNVTGVPNERDRIVFDIALGVYYNPTLLPSLNATIQLERPANTILDDMQGFLNTLQ